MNRIGSERYALGYNTGMEENSYPASADISKVLVNLIMGWMDGVEKDNLCKRDRI